jgi:hypothetical protein
MVTPVATSIASLESTDDTSDDGSWISLQEEKPHEYVQLLEITLARPCDAM